MLAFSCAPPCTTFEICMHMLCSADAYQCHIYLCILNHRHIFSGSKICRAYAKERAALPQRCPPQVAQPLSFVLLLEKLFFFPSFLHTAFVLLRTSPHISQITKADALISLPCQRGRRILGYLSSKAAAVWCGLTMFALIAQPWGNAAVGFRWPKAWPTQCPISCC